MDGGPGRTARPLWIRQFITSKAVPAFGKIEKKGLAHSTRFRLPAFRPRWRTGVGVLDSDTLPGMTETQTPTIIRIAHSPDSDDAFMFYALTQGVLDVEGLEIRHVLQDIESLNQAAFQGTYEITALSFHGYAHLADRYQIMPSGASFGDGYGPIVVSREPLGRTDLPGLKVAI